jgi:hypothetical protein
LNSTICVLSRLPAAPAEVEGVMRANHVKTMASGNLDTVMKIFFYAGVSFSPLRECCDEDQF